MYKITLFTMFFFVTGCASQKATGIIKESVLSEVAECQFVASVAGTSGWGGLAASSGIENAKEQAKQQAIDSGASHIVWHSINGGYSPSVSANAYKCEAK
ncbi:MAG: hypothetical protein ACKVH6_00090 [Enterobacterales bacterium]